MRNSRHIARVLQRVGLLQKNLGLLGWAAPFVVNVLFPLGAVLAYLKYGQEPSTRWLIMTYAQTLLPFSAAWWILFAFRDHIESDGNEVLAVYQRQYFCPDALILFGFYAVNVLIVMFLLSLFVAALWLEALRILMVSTLCFGLVSILQRMLRQVTGPLILLLLYTLINILYSDTLGEAARLPYWYSSAGVYAPAQLLAYVPHLLLGTALFIAAALVPWHRTTFLSSFNNG